jgi:uncharacterized protein
MGISSAWTDESERVIPVETQAFLRTRAADAFSLALFAGGALALTQSLPFMSSEALGALAIGVTALGPLGGAIERGAARRLTWRGAVGVGTFAGMLYGGGLWALEGDLAAILWSGAGILFFGTLLARFGSRFDRGEEGWRAAARSGPALGFSPLADRIGGVRLATPLRWLLLPLLPLELVARGLCLAAILLYQLTLSRLMPPACRYEPTCSRYGFHAYLRHGSVVGSVLTALRLLRCSPMGSGGFDPVPKAGPLLPWSKR